MADGALDHIQDIGEANRYTVLKYVDQGHIYCDFFPDRYPKAFFVKSFLRPDARFHNASNYSFGAVSSSLTLEVSEERSSSPSHVSLILC